MANLIKYGNNFIMSGGDVLKINNLEPGNIKSGVNVGGVVGTFEGAGDVGITNFITGVTKDVISNVEIIGANRFLHYAGGITKIDLPNCKTIEGTAFSRWQYSNNSTRLSLLNLPKVQTIGNGAFMNLGAEIPDVLNLPECLEIAASAFLGSISNGYGSTSSAFSGLRTLNAPKVQTIGASAFDYPNNYSSIRGGLTSLDLPECLSIGNYAFRPMNLLTSINLPKCTSIGTGAFYSANKSLTLTLGANQVCTLVNVNAFNGITTSNPITCYVPSELVEDYKVANNWSTLYDAGKITFNAIT